jgi:hypothetical protein
MKFYKVLGGGGEPCNGGSGKWNLPKGKRPGKWMPKIQGIVPCERGYHLCRAEDLMFWLNEEIYEAEGRGKSIRHDNSKDVFEQARLIRKIEPWNEKTACLFAADCAEHVLPIFERKHPKDQRPRLAIKAARDFANGKIDAAAWAAARDAAGDAARDAAGAAARDAAWDAARDAAGAAARAAAGAAAGAAAWAAARAAAWDAAWDAAWAAAGAAAGAAARDAAGAAARAAAGAAERKWQMGRLFFYLEIKNDRP